jgi:sulfur-oxidizing protein SoxB
LGAIVLSRRDFVQVAAAIAAYGVSGGVGKAAVDQRITQDLLLQFDSVGQVTLLHYADLHAQLLPVYYREPSTNFGVGSNKGVPPHLTGQDFLNYFGLAAGTPDAYALSNVDFVALAKEYGRMGGVSRLATLIKAIRAARPGKTLLFDGGDSTQGSYTALKTRGEDMVKTMNALGVEATTGHWEFTYGADRLNELIAMMKFPFLGGNVKDATWGDDVFPSNAYFDRGGIKVGVIGQTMPYTPIANPKYLIPDLSMGIEEDRLIKHIAEAKAEGAELIVLLSHNGFDVDRKLATRVAGIDVILTSHTHDAIPKVVKAGDTLLVAPGSAGKFLARLDVDVKNKKVADYRFRLIPVFSDSIQPDAEMEALVTSIRAPFMGDIQKVLGTTDSLLYRRGNFSGTFDDLICQAIIQERDTQIALSPGFRWAHSLLPGQDIIVDDVFSYTGLTYPNCYRNMMTGQQLKDILEDVADNLFNPDPYYQQGGDMVRTGGLSYTFNIANSMGSRISNMALTKTGEKLDPSKTYVVGGWASVNPGTEGPPIYDVVSDNIKRRKTIVVPDNHDVQIVGA